MYCISQLPRNQYVLRLSHILFEREGFIESPRHKIYRYIFYCVYSAHYISPNSSGRYPDRPLLLQVYLGGDLGAEQHDVGARVHHVGDQVAVLLLQLHLDSRTIVKLGVLIKASTTAFSLLQLECC